MFPWCKLLKFQKPQGSNKKKFPLKCIKIWYRRKKRNKKKKMIKIIIDEKLKHNQKPFLTRIWRNLTLPNKYPVPSPRKPFSCLAIPLYANWSSKSPFEKSFNDQSQNLGIVLTLIEKKKRNIVLRPICNSYRMVQSKI